jgi:NhaP-type Na+/H+ or K+/H+ antiporter
MTETSLPSAKLAARALRGGLRGVISLALALSLPVGVVQVSTLDLDSPQTEKPRGRECTKKGKPARR